ncbi:hypothetical protein PAXINDRAFT_172547 [Paxillus involutus ATCC 200175]|uniref:Uncharacterized protein n=1 Tax=Paxillus involutus ATCC 200175 TaxID=664439 RepID=A0A0C9TEA3_PAXIN|nr:hypothetical protein PAXINDRAFT_172547 [Paxillus involutus ATCC 200175]
MTNRTRRQGATNWSAARSPPPYYEAVPSVDYSSMPVSRYSETTPLIRKEKHWKEWLLGVTVVMIFVLISVVIVDFSIRATRQLCNDPLDPDVRDRIRKEWDRELLQHDELARNHQEHEETWKTEQIAHDELLEEWNRERKAHDRQKMERERREEDERRRRNMFWVDVEPHGCTSYATREYTARLTNVPSNYNRRVEACKATPLVVHDQSYLPRTCEDNGSNGIIGTWKVNQNQPDCVTSWTDYKVKGCTSVGSGRRYIEHRLDNLQPGGNWREFSATTPVRFHGMQFSGAEESFQSVWGVYGLWEIDDDEC